MAPKFFQSLHLVSSKPPDYKAAPEDAPATQISARSLALCSQAESRELIPRQTAEHLGILPLGSVEILGVKTFTVAVTVGSKAETESALKFSLDMPIRSVELPRATIDEAIFIAYCGDEKKLIISQNELSKIDTGIESSKKTLLAFRPPEGEVGTFLATLIEYGISHGASDIHLIPRSTGTMVRMRINGELLSRDESLCSGGLHKQLVTRVKVLAGVVTTKCDVPHDGSFSVPIGTETARVRVSTLPTIHGEKVVLRLIKAGTSAKLESLDFDDGVLRMIEHALQQRHGMILIAGPTGSGKSSTLYGCANRCALNGMSVSSVEDPVEQLLSNAAQSQVDDARGLTFPVCLRSVVRQDPDVILVGEMRDRESVSIAIQAALTGHLLITSLHAASISGILHRLHSLEAPAALVAETASLLVNQRLLPQLCDQCKVIDLQHMQRHSNKLYRAVGCSRCDYSGFAGRVPIAQALAVDDSVRQILFDKKSQTSGSSLHLKQCGTRFIDWRQQIVALLDSGSIDVRTAEQYLV